MADNHSTTDPLTQSKILLGPPEGFPCGKEKSCNQNRSEILDQEHSSPANLSAQVLESQIENVRVVFLNLVLEVMLELGSSVGQYNGLGTSLDNVRAFESILINGDVLHLGTLFLKSVLDILNVIVSHMEFVFKNMKGLSLTV
jgi:hypothetical protein